MGVQAYLKKKVTGVSTFATFSAFVTVAIGADYVWNTYFEQQKGSAPLVWGLSVAFFLFLFFGLLNYCWYAQSVLEDEIERITQVKARLESQLLKTRLSSSKRKKR
jgi:RsiW-degrading membrane proteinase PrsW (M82 family)